MTGNVVTNNAGIFLLLVFPLALIILIILLKELWHVLKTEQQKAKREIIQFSTSTGKAGSFANQVRKVVIPDAVDEAPNGYLVIDDAGREIFARSFTIMSMPRRTTFARTFSGLFDFPDCTSSVFIEPIANGKMSRDIDQHLVVLESEYIDAEGNTNRQRKLNGEYAEAEGWAKELESGDNKFFKVGFLYTLFADSLKELNKKSDAFRAEANEKDIQIASAYGVQAEAYLANAPLNNRHAGDSAIFDGKSIKMFTMDIYSCSTIYNYTQSSFTHKRGIPVGHDMFTKKIVHFDNYDASHDGFSIIFAGKTGVGKSLLIKLMAFRYSLLGYRFVCVDSQQKKGTSEGEFAGLSHVMNGVNFQLTNDSAADLGKKKVKRNILNPYDISETTRTIMTSVDKGYEVRDLALNDHISLVVNSLMAMVQQDKPFTDGALEASVKECLTDIAKLLYEEKEIYNGQPDSLYTTGEVFVKGKLTTGKTKKLMPTVCETYKKALLFAKRDAGTEKTVAWNFILSQLKENVRELYYSKQSLIFLPDMTQEEYRDLPMKPHDQLGVRQMEINGVMEDIVEIRGIRPYFDGQSTFAIDKKCRFTNIDLSLLPENEKVVARQIAFMFVNEMYIKANSESLSDADKLVAIFDEAHENFRIPVTRETLESIARTARKRNVGLWLSTQTVKEYDRTDETRDILKQATAKFVAKQASADKDYLKTALEITDAQADIIVNKLGGSGDNDVSVNRRGEFCLIDNRKVCFLKVDYFKETEAVIAETSAAGIAGSLQIAKKGA